MRHAGLAVEHRLPSRSNSHQSTARFEPLVPPELPGSSVEEGTASTLSLLPTCTTTSPCRTAIPRAVRMPRTMPNGPAAKRTYEAAGLAVTLSQNGYGLKA